MRDAAFKRGIAYLERYCMLIAFTVYLQRTKQMGMSVTFRVSEVQTCIHTMTGLHCQQR